MYVTFVFVCGVQQLRIIFSTQPFWDWPRNRRSSESNCLQFAKTTRLSFTAEWDEATSIIRLQPRFGLVFGWKSDELSYPLGQCALSKIIRADIWKVYRWSRETLDKRKYPPPRSHPPASLLFGSVCQSDHMDATTYSSPRLNQRLCSLPRGLWLPPGPIQGAWVSSV